jgi:hypothetical protein
MELGADANCDGSVNATDAVTLLRTLTGSASDCSRGDANCDGEINSADVARVLRIAAGVAQGC